MYTEHNIEELFEKYSDMVYRIAISYGNQVQFAEDVVQEVYSKRNCQ